MGLCRGSRPPLYFAVLLRSVSLELHASCLQLSDLPQAGCCPCHGDMVAAKSSSASNMSMVKSADHYCPWRVIDVHRLAAFASDLPAWPSCQWQSEAVNVNKCLLHWPSCSFTGKLLIAVAVAVHCKSWAAKRGACVMSISPGISAVQIFLLIRCHQLSQRSIMVAIWQTCCQICHSCRYCSAEGLCASLELEGIGG